MRAYKCDICGKYCEDCHNVYGSILIQAKKNNSKKMKNINELCDKYFEYMDKNSK